MSALSFVLQQQNDGLFEYTYSFAFGGGSTTSLPNRPCCSSSGPAVKKRVFVGPLAGAPLPKAKAQRPSISIGGPSAAWSGPRCWNSPRRGHDIGNVLRG